MLLYRGSKNYKSQGITLFWSLFGLFIFPGLGYFYLGNMRAAFIIPSLTTTVNLAFIYMTSGTYNIITSYPYISGDYTKLLFVMIALVTTNIFIILFSIIHSHRLCSAFNTFVDNHNLPMYVPKKLHQGLFYLYVPFLLLFTGTFYIVANSPW